MNILLWHVHGAWTTAFVQGKHRYLLPVTDDRGPWGRGRARTFDWPETVEEVPYEHLAGAEIDLVLLQRPEELDLLELWAASARLPKVYVEHNTPRTAVPDSRHPLADRDDVVIVHVTHFNDLFWDCGRTRTTVIEHGIVPPRARYTGELERLAVVTNEPVRRGRVTGTDLFPRFAAAAPLDVFGMGVAGLAAERIAVFDDLPQAAMHAELARRRAYLHLCRWTSLGLSLIEAMAIGLPVVALATTEAVAAVPPEAGVLSTDVGALTEAARWLIASPGEARRLGAAGRAAALRRYGLDRFLADWDRLLEEELCASR
ncbi:glycosyltransferase [Dactylosporangium sp. CS-033363]|uniref:glycosyltransferase n=1 Tax=Dactylosporangium sp. CS-033363 TaxID=3239935 RepID=UPI003D8C4C8C